MSELSLRLLNDFQRGFPLTPAPFEVLARRLGMGMEELLETLRRLVREGVVSRVGAVFHPHRIGVSTLAAMAVPEARLAEVAQQINAHAEVNHNYEREHRFNLWFVAAAATAGQLERVLQQIEHQTGLGIMRLPMLRDYHIDLAFDLRSGVALAPEKRAARAQALALDARDYALIAAIQDGLPLVAHPYAAVGAAVGMGEAEVLYRLERFLEHGIIKRLGIVVRHHELGFRANAMVVWDIPDERIDEFGHAIGASGLVTLCYQRPRHLPQWPYNLFCMIHGKDRTAVLERLELLRDRCGLANFRNEVLFSKRRFKQTGARYVQTWSDAAKVA